MDEEKNKEEHSKKELILSVVVLLILVGTVVGMSYAAFDWISKDNEENKVTTGTVAMTYTTNSNGINITNALPMTDAQGKALKDTSDTDHNTTFKFTVSATISGNVLLSYEIGMHKNSGTLQDNDIHFYLVQLVGDVETPVKVASTANEEGVFTFQPNGTVSSVGVPAEDMVVASGTFNATANQSYLLRMWLREDYVLENREDTYSVTVNAYAHAN